MTNWPLGVGIVGLGRAFMLTLPALVRHNSIRIAAAMDPRPEARARFETEFGARGYDSLEGLLGDPAVEAVYIASPHSRPEGMYWSKSQWRRRWPIALRWPMQPTTRERS